MQSQRFYRRLHRELVLAERPREVLDVGCGDGAFLRELAEAGVRCEGAEPDEARSAAVRGDGFIVRVAHGEQLPYPDGAFDVVASAFSAHHMRDLAAFLAEACRVARRAVVVLDPWYDLTIASQRTAERWDRWFKAIDRREGRVHEDFLTAEAFRAALPRTPEVSFECRHSLLFRPMDESYFERETADYLPRCEGDSAALAELAEIRADKARHGISEDGAIHVILRR